MRIDGINSGILYTMHVTEEKNYHLVLHMHIKKRHKLCESSVCTHLYIQTVC